ncbi:MAG TPA: DUF4837 family protein [Bacteroidaceae bacterium]|nr:DUF4837 family protein [Bacteroidaceae bacterium]
MKSLYSVLIFTVALLVSSCSSKKGTIFTNASSGKPFELLVVVQDEHQWDTAVGKALFNALDTDVPMLPQPERSFHIMHCSKHDFDNTMKLLRNIIIVDINPDRYTQSKFKTLHDEYAAPQALLRIQSPSASELATFINAHKNVIIDFFTRAEMQRTASELKRNHSNIVSQKVDSLFGYNVWVSPEFASTKCRKDFFWTRADRSDCLLNYVMYSYPFESDSTFTLQYYIAKRDSFMKANIPGSEPGMYVETDPRFIQKEVIEVQGQYCMEVRGLWDMKNDMMGGPFVSHTMLDKVNNRIVTSEVFLFAPRKPKADMLRFLEASLYTMQLPGMPLTEAIQKETSEKATHN